MPPSFVTNWAAELMLGILLLLILVCLFENFWLMRASKKVKKLTDELNKLRNNLMPNDSIETPNERNDANNR